MEVFIHPRRFAKNAPGPFYTTGDECGDCLFCGAPEHEAPDLLALLEGDNHDTYFVRQPETPEETERACRALEACCVSALRYGGCDRWVIERLGNDPGSCDYVMDTKRELVASIGANGDFEPALAVSMERARFARRNRFRAVVQGREIVWRFAWLEFDAVLPPTPARRSRERRRALLALVIIALMAAAWLLQRAW